MTDTSTTQTVTLTPAEYAATKAKIAKINARAAKRGFTGHFDVSGNFVTKTTRDQFGFSRTVQEVETTITGTAPKYQGWEFQARVERVGESFVVSAVPGIEVSREGITPGECDHCGQHRSRKATYVVVNETTGERRQVGSTCIKDFLGWDGNVVWIDPMKEVSEDWDSNGPEFYSVETVIAYAWAATKVFGWVPAGRENSTADRVRVLTGVYRIPQGQEREYRQVQEFAAQAQEHAAEIVKWVASDDFSGNSGYVENLKVVCAAEFVESKHFGLLASAPATWSRHHENRVQRETVRQQVSQSEYVGQEGDKIEFTATISSVRYVAGDYGTTTLYTFVTPEGNSIKWFCSGKELKGPEVVCEEAGWHPEYGHLAVGDIFRPDAKVGDVVALKATVKRHEEYQGVKSTLVTRAKEVK